MSCILSIIIFICLWTTNRRQCKWVRTAHCAAHFLYVDIKLALQQEDIKDGANEMWIWQCPLYVLIMVAFDHCGENMFLNRFSRIFLISVVSNFKSNSNAIFAEYGEKLRLFMFGLWVSLVSCQWPWFMWRSADPNECNGVHLTKRLLLVWYFRAAKHWR